MAPGRRAAPHSCRALICSACVARGADSVADLSVPKPDTSLVVRRYLVIVTHQLLPGTGLSACTFWDLHVIPRAIYWLTAMRTSKGETVGVFSRAASTYNLVGPRHFTYFADRLADYAEIRRDERVLDLGTGTGEVLLAAAERSQGNGWAVGIDVAAPMLQRAREAVRNRGLTNVGLLQMDAERLALPNDQVVLSAFALSSFPNRDLALNECWRVLEPDGLLAVVDAPGWYFEHDRRWYWQGDILRSFGALHNAGGNQANDLPSALISMGWQGVESIDDTFALVFQSEEEWWRWLWSHGTRRLLEAVPPARLSELKQHLVSGLRRCLGHDGKIHGSMRGVLVRASKPKGFAQLTR